MKLGRDLAAGVGASLWSMAAALVAVPVFIAYLGVEAYGLIGFSTSLQAFLLLLDFGLAPTISRQIARASVSDGMAGARNLLRSMAWIYWPVALLIGAALTLLAPFIAVHWLNPETLSPAVVRDAVMLMGLQLALRWPSGLYLGALTGAHRLVLANAIGAAYATAAHLGAAAVLAFWSPTIHAFFLWQAAAGLAYTLALQHAAWRAVGGGRTARFDKQELRQVWRFMAGVTGIALASIAITQVDKVILSKLISLEAFGHYMVAMLAVSSLYRITMPLFNTVYPRFSALVADAREPKLTLVYEVVSNLFASLWYPGIMLIAVCAKPLLLLWTGDAEIAARAAPLLSLLALGTGFHGSMFIPYALLLAYGQTRLAFRIHMMLVAVQIPLVLVLALRFGALGGAAAWLVLFALYVLIGTTMTHRRILTDLRYRLLLTDLGRPFLATLPFGLAGLAIMPLLPQSAVLQVTAGLGLALLATLACALLSPYRRAQIKLALAD